MRIVDAIHEHICGNDPCDRLSARFSALGDATEIFHEIPQLENDLTKGEGLRSVRISLRKQSNQSLILVFKYAAQIS